MRKRKHKETQGIGNEGKKNPGRTTRVGWKKADQGNTKKRRKNPGRTTRVGWE